VAGVFFGSAKADHRNPAPRISATFLRAAGSSSMNTPLKVLLAVAIFFAVAHFFPVLFLPFALVGFLFLALFGIVSVVAGTGIAAIMVVFSAVIALAAALSPIWVPIALIVGIICLCRRDNSNIHTV
jgi:hypothetical protein